MCNSKLEIDRGFTSKFFQKKHTMKLKSLKDLLLLIAIFIISNSSCKSKSQSDAVQLAKDLQTAVKENTPGSIPASTTGYTMTAKINGRSWVANAMMPPEPAGRIIGYYNKESISLPYDRRDMVVGNKTRFGENQAVDLFTNDDVGIWGGRKGEMEITKVNDKSAEGKFYFTATASGTDKTMEVTDGFFRIMFN
jgi:hypothetical protein